VKLCVAIIEGHVDARIHVLNVIMPDFLPAVRRASPKVLRGESAVSASASVSYSPATIAETIPVIVIN